MADNDNELDRLSVLKSIDTGTFDTSKFARDSSGLTDKKNVSAKQTTYKVKSKGQKDTEIHDEEKRKLNNENRLLEQKHEIRENITPWVQWVVVCYLIFIGLILISLAGIFLWKEKSWLEPSVLIALLTTTTINILGLPYLILKEVFADKKQISKDTSKSTYSFYHK
jgi:cytochrome bd-type quinol oxidase subunit 2